MNSSESLNDSSVLSELNDGARRTKPLICCVHGIKCEKGRKEKNETFSLLNYYIGALSRRQARRRCRERTAFRLFHELSHDDQLDNLKPELKLYIIYRTSTGEYCYFPIIEQDVKIGHSIPRTYTCYYVDYPDAPKFTSIDGLIKYFTVYVQMRRNKRGEVDADVFPWWEIRQ